MHAGGVGERLGLGSSVDPSYDHQRAHRTSNRVDRLMAFLDRACFNAQAFHGTVTSAELRVRALALLFNTAVLAPYCLQHVRGGLGVDISTPLCRY